MKQEKAFMKVKWFIKDDKALLVRINKEEFTVSYMSDDKQIFHAINKVIINNLTEKISFELNIEGKGFHCKVGKSIVNTYLREINKIRNDLNISDIELSEINE